MLPEKRKLRKCLEPYREPPKAEKMSGTVPRAAQSGSLLFSEERWRGRVRSHRKNLLGRRKKRLCAALLFAGKTGARVVYQSEI